MQLYAPTSTTPKRKAFRAPVLASIDGLRLGILENGKLNAEEAQAARAAMQAKREEMQKKLLAEFDTDKDGKLSEEERKAVRTAMEAKRKALIEKYDADGDGKLSPEEIKTARDAGEELPMMGGPGGPGERRGQGGKGGEGRPPRGERPAPPAGE